MSLLREDETMSNEAKCNCQRCGEHIAFPVEITGQEITCPHCGRETTLLLSQARKANPDSSATMPRDESKSAMSDVTTILFGIIGLAVVVIPLALLVHHQSVREQEDRNLQQLVNAPISIKDQIDARITAGREHSEYLLFLATKHSRNV